MPKRGPDNGPPTASRIGAGPKCLANLCTTKAIRRLAINTAETGAGTPELPWANLLGADRRYGPIPLPLSGTLQLGSPTARPRSIRAWTALTAQNIAPANPLFGEIRGITAELQTPFTCKINDLRT